MPRLAPAPPLSLTELYIPFFRPLMTLTRQLTTLKNTQHAAGKLRILHTLLGDEEAGIVLPRHVQEQRGGEGRRG